ncbi:hypothetical protein [Methylobacterium iners]|uniref:TonB-dependent receptor n=1 Tax=Methylobacterium iners TaxID=418707 RepID=A0ABQ4RSW0_9HYPH|nr:hypothetical protein [Methylobacterium iners]GJD93804.1 hypothetical protein OCOJLMKI_1002 [Methylobacterium iners]
MSHLRSTVTAALLSLSAAAVPALANSDSAIDQTPIFSGAAAPVRLASDDDLTTGSIGVRRQVSSAKEGNAEQTNFAVPQYGQTSGGHAR